MIARLLSHGTLVTLGRYTLEVYLLQMPLHDFFLWTRAPGARGLWRGLPWTPEVFWFYLLLLWTTCGLFVEFMAEPLNQRVKSLSSTRAHVATSLSSEQSRLPQYEQLQFDLDNSNQASTAK